MKQFPYAGIPRETGLELLRYLQNLRGYHAYFLDSERDFVCGVLNGKTMLEDGETRLPIQCGFLDAAKQSESFDLIEIKSAGPNFKTASLVGIAYELRRIGKGRIDFEVEEGRLRIVGKVM